MFDWTNYTCVYVTAHCVHSARQIVLVCVSQGYIMQDRLYLVCVSQLRYTLCKLCRTHCTCGCKLTAYIMYDRLY